jgi:cell division cycle 2-like protein
MDYVEHDLKSLMTHTMKKPFAIGEVKTLMYQLLSGVNHLHDNWIIHRDLKTSNLLLSNKGILKVRFFIELSFRIDFDFLSRSQILVLHANMVHH